MTENETRQSVFLKGGKELAGKFCEIVERVQVKTDPFWQILWKNKQ